MMLNQQRVMTGHHVAYPHTVIRTARSADPESRRIEKIPGSPLSRAPGMTLIQQRVKAGIT